jgi:proline iminopeptidase
VLGLAAPAFYGRWVLPRLLTWGATAEEVSGSYPGDELVPDAEGSSTMATTLPAPPEKVWPWLVQMGVGRAGWYSWDRLDNHGEPSADRIVPEWQSLEEGRRLNATPDGQTWFTVAVLRPGRTLVLRSDLDLKAGHSFEYRAGPLPRAYLAGVWGFHLRPAPGGGTRLVARTRGKGRPRAFTRVFDLVGQPAHFVMQTRQFRNLRRRVRASA